MLFRSNILDHRLETVELPKQSLRTAGTLVFPLWMHSLKRIVTGKLCGDDVRFVEIDGLEKLESISFGERSFTTNKEWYYNWARWTTDGLLRILNCPNLELPRVVCFSLFESFIDCGEAAREVASVSSSLLCLLIRICIFRLHGQSLPTLSRE